MEDSERFTNDELELLALAWALAQGGKLFCPEDAYLPECYRLNELGWFKREWHGDDLVYGWSPQAEAALDINQLVASARGSVN
jgi:hypothetical protein